MKQALERLAYESAATAVQGYLELTSTEVTMNGGAERGASIDRDGFLIRGTSVRDEFPRISAIVGQHTV